MTTSIVLFRKDLRIHDHPPLYYAAQRGTVIPVFIKECTTINDCEEAYNWWLHHSLFQLSRELEKLNMPLIIREGDVLEELETIINATNATAIYVNHRYNETEIIEDKRLSNFSQQKNISFYHFHGNVLLDPSTLLNGQGEPYKIFTPFWKKFNHYTIDKPLTKPACQQTRYGHLDSLAVDDLQLIKNSATWVNKLVTVHIPGEAEAITMLNDFLTNNLAHYNDRRDFPYASTVSQLSPYLAHGNISMKSVWHAVIRAKAPIAQKEAFMRQLMWREFAINQLFHNPTMATSPLREQFKKFPWQGTQQQLELWQQGKTGFPLVDAGMRELWATGVMHNRVRMVVASFLTKHLLVSWVKGSNWFRQTLVDFDEANNASGWQWTAGCGIDASPYFRIFNPTLQSEKFDKEGQYIAQWVPELANLPAKYIHNPSQAPKQILADAQITLGITYPFPIVDHKAARERALAIYKEIK